jgi:hypothetical protein
VTSRLLSQILLSSLSLGLLFAPAGLAAQTPYNPEAVAAKYRSDFVIYDLQQKGERGEREREKRRGKRDSLICVVSIRLESGGKSRRSGCPFFPPFSPVTSICQPRGLS